MKSNERKIIKRGDCILTETPFAYVLKSKYRKERCDYCLKSTKVLKCSNCQYVNYCGQECQRKAWTLHKIECPMLKSIYPRNVPDAARMLCRLIIKLNKGGDLERSYYTEKCSRRFRDLMSHYAEIKNDAKRLEHLESLYMVLAEMMNGTGLLPNQTELLGIYGRLITNGFNILDGEMNVIGTGIYMGVSVTDHSCVPNAVATFEGTTLHIYAIADIECLDWSKIFISYIDLLNTTEQRRRDLKENYYFLCVCSKCIDPNELEEITGAACPNVDCSEMVNIEASECSSCKAAISASYRSNFNEVLQFTQDKLAEMRDIAFLDVCKICLKKQKQLLHPLNLWHIKTLDAAFEAAIEVGKWSDALEYGRKLLPGFRKYYGDWNPLLGLLYLKIGKIQLYIEQQKAAIDNFQEAKKILTITHGAGHSLLREALLPMFMQAVAESK